MAHVRGGGGGGGAAAGAGGAVIGFPQLGQNRTPLATAVPHFGQVTAGPEPPETSMEVPQDGQNFAPAGTMVSQRGQGRPGPWPVPPYTEPIWPIIP